MTARAPIYHPDWRRMNRGEQQYAQHLDQLIACKSILRWWFEGITLRLADATHYRADFLVQLPDGTMEIHEVKGRKGDSFYAMEDAWLKLKIAARLFPFPVLVKWPLKGGGWGSEMVTPMEKAA